MKRSLSIIVALTGLAGLAVTVSAEPPSKSSGSTQMTSSAMVKSANGWTNVKGEWVHPEGYKFVDGKITRTTARPGRTVPKAPGKLALANPDKLTPEAIAASQGATKTVSDKGTKDKATERARNLAPRPAPQTGSNIY